MEQRRRQRGDAQSQDTNREVQKHPQQENGQQITKEEQAVPAAPTQHLPGTVRVEEPQEAQHPALVHQVGVVDIKNGAFGVRRVLALSFGHFSQPSQRETVEDYRQRCIHVLQRFNAGHTVRDCQRREGQELAAT